MHDVRHEVRTFIEENLLMVGGNLPDDVSLQKRGIIDSTGVLELVGFLETRFSITVEDDELRPENLDSILAIDRFVRSKLAAAAC